MTERFGRPRLEDLDLNLGKRTRLHRLLHQYGPGNGTMLLLPIDHGLEHGPRDFFSNPASLDPEYMLQLAAEARFSGIVFHLGLAEKYMHSYVGRVPLVLKLNGKTNIPSDEAPFSGQIASVEDAARLGADAVGYTLYVGSAQQHQDFLQFQYVRQEAERLGMPIIVWAYPRGRDIEDKGGRDSLYAIEYAARVAAELGADVVKLNPPTASDDTRHSLPESYRDLRVSEAEAISRVVRAAGRRTMVLLSGGPRLGDEDLLARAQWVMEAGGTGLIFGRNFWQRPFDEAVQLAERMREILRETRQ